MKLKKALLVGSALMSLSSISFGAAIQSSSLFELDGTLTGSDKILLSATTGNPLATGFAASGTFGISDAQVLALVGTNSFSSLVSAFASGVTLASTSNFAGSIDAVFGLTVPGAYAYSVANFNPTSIIGQSLYTFVGNGTTLATSTSYLLYKHSNTLAADPAIPPESNYDLKLSGGTLLIGTAGTKTLNIPDLKGNGVYNTITLVGAAVPEPSAALLGALGALGLLRRRRI